jgi:VWFA-related protein
MIPGSTLAYARSCDCEPSCYLPDFRSHSLSSRRLSFHLASAVLILALAASLTAQQAPQPSAPDAPSTPTRPYILLDVIPTDPLNRPVVGLTQQDFHISEKVGWVTTVPEDIASFRMVDKSGQSTLTEPHELLRKPPETHGDALTEREPNAPLTVLLLDNLNTDLFSPAIRSQIATLGDFGWTNQLVDPTVARVPIAVLLLGKKLELLQDFDSDRKTLQSTLQNTFTEKLNVTVEAVDPSGAVSSPPKNPDASDDSSLPLIRDWDRIPPGRSDLERRALMTMDALRSIARHLAGYPGRKRLIWVSSTFPFSITPEPCANGLDDVSSCRSPAATLMDALLKARVSVYPIHPGHVSVAPHQTVSAVTTSEQEGTAEVATMLMTVFAGQTGGRTCLDEDLIANCFNRALHDGMLDYEIAYYPSTEQRPATQKGFHRIAVQTTAPHVQLSFPLYYYVHEEEPAAADFDLKQAACDDLMTATSLSLTAQPESAPPEPTKFSLAVDGKGLTTASIPGNPHRVRLHLDFAVCAFDAHGNPLRLVQYSSRADLSAQEFDSIRQHGFHHALSFQTPPGTAFLRWVVRDSLSGNLGSVDISYRQPPPAATTENEQLDHPAAAASPASASSAPVTSPTPEPAKAPQAAAVIHDFPPVDPDSDIQPYCAATATATTNPGALENLCRFTLSLPRKMPDVLSDLQTKRFWLAYNAPHRDTVTATVTYANGHEHYDNVRIDGFAVNGSSMRLNSSWSVGEFASILQMLFSPSSDAGFRFIKEEKLHSVPTLVFEFHVDQPNNLLYYLRALFPGGSGTTLFPGYHGQLWLNKSNFQLMRMVRETFDMPRSFPITRASTTIDYQDVPLGDGSRFVLPIKSEIETCSIGEGSECAHNTVRFRNWHKFRAKARILPLPSQ